MIVNAMAVVEVSAGQTIISKGEAGDAFYIVASGQFTASIDGKNVKSYGPKQVSQPQHSTIASLPSSDCQRRGEKR